MITTRRATQTDEERLLEIYASAVPQRDTEADAHDIANPSQDIGARNQNAGEAKLPESIVPATEFSRWLQREQTRVIVAEQYRDILGWGVLFLDEAPIATVFVDPEASRTETRDRLLSHIERIAADGGVEDLFFLTY